MLFRVSNLPRNLVRVSQHAPVVARCMSGHAPSHWLTDKQIDSQTNAHMDKLPVPEGAWEEGYRKNQAKFNIQLLLSLGVAVGTIIGMYKAKCFSFNPHPPMKNED